MNVYKQLSKAFRRTTWMHMIRPGKPLVGEFEMYLMGGEL